MNSSICDMGTTDLTSTVPNVIKYNGSIAFSNGWVASIIDTKMIHTGNSLRKRFSIAVRDREGCFDWNVLVPYGANENGCIEADGDDEILKALNVIECL